MASREIITLQIGNYSNFVGAHWFNIQEEYLDPNSDFDPVVTWRQSLDRSGGIRSSSWSPRVLIFDLRQHWSGQFTSSSGKTSKSAQPSKHERDKSLLEAERNVLWDGSVQRVGELEDDLGGLVSEKRRKENNIGVSAPEVPCAISTKLEKIELGHGDTDNQKLQSWSEIIRWSLPSSEKVAFSLPNLSHNPEANNLPNYGQGLSIYEKIKDDVEDGIRFYAEDCDCLQGFHLIVDQNDGFSGFAKGILQHISDEYDKKCCFAFGVSPADCEGYKDEQAANFRNRLLNTALSWSGFNQHCSAFTSLGLCDDICKPGPTPSSCQWLTYKGDHSYESSAILAAALDTLTMSYRVKSLSFGFPELAGLLNAYGHKMTVLGSAFPLSLLGRDEAGNEMVHQSLFHTLNENGLDKVFQSLTPGISLEASLEQRKSIGNFFLGRGIPESRVISEKESKALQQQLRGVASTEPISSAQSCLELYCQETYSRSVNVVRTSPSPFKLAYPFPTNLVDSTFLQTEPKFCYQAQDFWKLPAMASAHNTAETGVLLEKLLEEVSPVKMRRSNFSFGEGNIDEDDYSECLNDLRTLRDAYDNN